MNLRAKHKPSACRKWLAQPACMCLAVPLDETVFHRCCGRYHLKCGGRIINHNKVRANGRWVFHSEWTVKYNKDGTYSRGKPR